MIPRRPPPSLLFVVGAVSLYGGAALATGLFDEIAPGSVAWLRSATAAACLLAVTRPSVRGWSPGRWCDTVVFGFCAVSMNAAFYLAISRLPLGTAVAIEFLGPVAVGLAGCRSRRNLAALALAAAGVALLAGIEATSNLAGLGWIAVASACWAGYVVWGTRVAAHRTGVEGLAVALACGTLLWAPVLAPATAPAWHSPRLAAAAAGVGVLSSAVPYGIDQYVMTRVSRTRFAILLAVLPTTAAVVGALVLRQVPTLVQVIGIVAVVAAVGIREPPGSEAVPPDPVPRPEA